MLDSSSINLPKIIEMTRATKQSDGYIGHCPGHEDSKPSYSFCIKDGKLVHHCFAGCDPKMIWNMLIQKGVVNQQATKKKSAVEYAIENSTRLCEMPAPPAISYLKKRGLNLGNIPAALRFDPRCRYYENKVLIGRHPAIVSVVTCNNRTVGAHRTYLAEDGSKADVLEAKKSIGQVSGGHILLGQYSDHMAVTEGLETGLAVYFATGLSVMVAISAGGMKNLEIPREVRKLEIFADNDKNNVGQQAGFHLQKIALSSTIEAQVHIPQLDLPGDAKGIDWLDVFAAYGANPLKQALDIPSAQAALSPPSSEWPQHQPMAFKQIPPPDLSKCDLPEFIKRFVFSEAKLITVSPDFIIAPLLVSLAATCGRNFTLRPEADSTWEVCGVLWGLICGRPGTKKTSAAKSGTRFIHAIERKFEADHKLQLESNRSPIRKIEQQIKNKKKEMDKVEANIDALSDDIDVLEKQLGKLNPKQKRIIFNNATVEKVIMILAENPNGLLHFRDEFSAFLISLCDAQKSQERGFYLESWNGNGSYCVDRVSRVGEKIENICISMFGGIQPGKLDPLIKGTMLGGREDDGLCQRYQILISDTVHPRKTKEAKVTDEEAIIVLHKFFQLVSEQPEKISFSFSQDAQETFDDWIINFHNNNLDHPTEWESLDAHYSKYVSLLPTLAMLFHLANSIDEKYSENSDIFSWNTVVWPCKISLKSLNQAFGFLEFLKQHAQRVYSVITKRDELAAAALASKIINGLIVDGDTVRSVKSRHWSNLNDNDDIELGLSILERQHWIRVDQVKPTTGRPKKVIRINPSLLLQMSQNTNPNFSSKPLE